jgi:hypothetical protein
MPEMQARTGGESAAGTADSGNSEIDPQVIEIKNG